MNAEKILLAILVSVWIAIVSVSSVLGCYAVVVGKEASADGSVLFGHNEQNHGNVVVNNLRVIPRMKHTPGEVVRLLRGGTLPEVGETYSFMLIWQMLWSN